MEVLFNSNSDNMFKNDIDRMREDFTAMNLGSKTWESVLKGIDDNIKVTPQNVKLFIYGIAIHSITDLYAHSAWKQLETGFWTRIQHPGAGKPMADTADDTQYYPMRYLTAREAAKSVLSKAYLGEVGSLYEFVYSASSYSGYYLGNFAPYAQKADPVLFASLRSYFEKGDLDYNTSNYDFNKYDYYTP